MGTLLQSTKVRHRNRENKNSRTFYVISVLSSVPTWTVVPHTRSRTMIKLALAAVCILLNSHTEAVPINQVQNGHQTSLESSDYQATDYLSTDDQSTDNQSTNNLSNNLFSDINRETRATQAKQPKSEIEDDAKHFKNNETDEHQKHSEESGSVEIILQGAIDEVTEKKKLKMIEDTWRNDLMA